MPPERRSDRHAVCPSEEEDSIFGPAERERRHSVRTGRRDAVRRGLCRHRRVDRISAVLAPRGPDGCGVWCRGPVAFGHRRLSIIDLSVDGSQPMVDSQLGLSRGLQRLHLQLPAAASRAGGPRTSVLLHLGHRGDRQGVRRVGPGLRRSLLRHVRVRDLRATHRQVDLGPGPAGDQAALSRPDPPAASLRLDAAGAVGRRGHRHRRSIRPRWPTT